jgi:hypothetical protein
MKPLSIPTESMTHCYHCGEPSESDAIEFDETVFCSTGCKVVYEIAHSNSKCDTLINLKRQSAFLQIALSVNLGVAYEYTQI